MRKTRQIAHLGDKGHRGYEVEALQAHQRPNDGVHAPVGALLAQRCSDALDAFGGFFGSLPILVESDLLRGMFEADRGKVPLMGRLQELLRR